MATYFLLFLFLKCCNRFPLFLLLPIVVVLNSSYNSLLLEEYSRERPRVWPRIGQTGCYNRL